MSRPESSRAGLRAKLASIVAAVAACALLAIPLSGCAGPQSLEMEEQPKTASQYMVDLNDKTGELYEKLGEFSEAVSEQRISAMQTKVQEAYAILDAMADLEAPDDISSVKEEYNDAAAQLKSALSAYITLYTEIYDSSQSGGFDYSTYAQRIEEVQKQYDAALGQLEQADEHATEM